MFYSHLPEKTPHSRGQAGECKPWTTKDLHHIILWHVAFGTPFFRVPADRIRDLWALVLPPITHVVWEARHIPEGTRLPFSNPFSTLLRTSEPESYFELRFGLGNR